jgi:hypothetical protein
LQTFGAQKSLTEIELNEWGIWIAWRGLLPAAFSGAAPLPLRPFGQIMTHAGPESAIDRRNGISHTSPRTIGFPII